jgi:hypothetical protein
LIGGRFLSGPGAARILVELDGMPVDEWIATRAPDWFVRWIDVPGGIPEGRGPYALLRVRVAPAAGNDEIVVGLEQFDAAGAGDVMWAYADGWNEPEGDPQTGRLWRWTTDASTIVIKDPSRDLRMIVRGESPRRSYGQPVEIVVRAGGTEVARFTPEDDFTQAIELPLALLSAGPVTIHPSRTFVPGERDGGPDRRRLGVRVYGIDIAPR